VYVQKTKTMAIGEKLRNRDKVK